ncbi:MAG: DUF2283 domain-containing protein [Leptolyngbyaceae cyanobacterium SL_7_1]|nr:DUF2283 domain-containing protein [Leptolyngbyaceae cyanobacterium SL_7_1]
MSYFKDENILHLIISPEPEARSIEISPNVAAELNAAGNLIRVEILNASTYMRDFILESIQGRFIGLISSNG